MSTATYDHVRELVKTLDPQEQRRLISEIGDQLSVAPSESEAEGKEAAADPPRTPYRSLWGVLKHLGPAPSAEEIDEARREAWANFPREDFYK